MVRSVYTGPCFRSISVRQSVRSWRPSVRHGTHEWSRGMALIELKQHDELEMEQILG